MTEVTSEQTTFQRLVELLIQPKKANAEWQTEAGRLASLIHLSTLAPETGDPEYLAAISLCRWAQASGVVAAKNQAVQATRFRTKEPPPLGALPQQELMTHALILLSDLRADWCKSYLTTLVAVGGLHKNDLKALGKWTAKNSKSIVDLVEVLVAPSTSSAADSKHVEACLKLAEKLVDQLKWPSYSIAARDFCAAANRLAEFISESPISQKVEKQLWAFARRASEHARKEHPSVLLETDFLKGINALCGNSSSAEKSKAVKASFSSLTAPTLSCLASLADRGGKDGLEFGRGLIPLLAATYTDFNKRLSDAAANSGVLAELQTPTSTGGSPSLEDAAASVYARLLPSWHDFYSTYAEAEKLTVMNANLLEAAAFNCIEFMGQAGEVVDFDPVAHRLQDGSLLTEKRVRLVRPTIVFRRSNGSYRVVLPAIVSQV